MTDGCFSKGLEKSFNKGRTALFHHFSSTPSVLPAAKVVGAHIESGEEKAQMRSSDRNRDVRADVVEMWQSAREREREREHGEGQWKVKR